MIQCLEIYLNWNKANSREREKKWITTVFIFFPSQIVNHNSGIVLLFCIHAENSEWHNRIVFMILDPFSGMVNRPHNTVKLKTTTAPTKKPKRKEIENPSFTLYIFLLTFLSVFLKLTSCMAMHAFNSVNIPSIYFHLDAFSFKLHEMYRTWYEAVAVFSCCRLNAHCIHCCIRLCELTKTNGIHTHTDIVSAWI